jgi:hydantoinase/carbamoylase family amidase
MPCGELSVAWVDPDRVLADLDELERLTGGPEGARRVCWTDAWVAARELLRGRLAELPVEVEEDEAGNLWAWLAGQSPESVAVGSHLDSVPVGGRLDGALGVMAALEVLRAVAAEGTPARGVVLVDWADEEGARFGRSLLGSSAFAGTLDPAAVRDLRDADGVALADALADYGVDVDAMAASGSRRERLAAYLELHIEQGPVLEAAGMPCAAVVGCAGVERHRVRFTGRAGHAGTTPMEVRRDAGVSAAGAIAGLPEIAARHGGVCTAGRLELSPGIATAVPGHAELLIDQRHLDPDALAAMLADARSLWESAAADEGCSVEAERIWAIEPVPFHDGLVSVARDACAEVAGSDRALPSGALHDAAEVARVLPAAMVFSSSVGGISHAPDEATREADLRAAIEAFGALARRVVTGGVPA